MQAKNLVPKSRVVDADKDGVVDSHDGVGCLVGARPAAARAAGFGMGFL